MNKSETLTDAIGTMHSGGAELEEQDLKPIKQGSLHLTPFGGGFTEKICSKVLSRVAKLVMALRRPCQTKVKETFGAFSIWEVHSMHASKNNQRHGFVRTRHHVVWPVWCACNKQVTSGTQHILMSHVAGTSVQRYC